jgi:hypothetical protein
MSRSYLSAGFILHSPATQGIEIIEQISRPFPGFLGKVKYEMEIYGQRH